jgi:hypothetical protein
MLKDLGGISTTELSRKGNRETGKVGRVGPVEAIDGGHIACGVESRVEVGLVTLESGGRGEALVIPGRVVGTSVAALRARAGEIRRARAVEEMQDLRECW